MKLIEFINKTIDSYINEEYSKKNIELIKKFYPEYYKNPKNKSEAVGWPSKEEQYKRFEILLNIGVKNGNSVLDFGCGLGALYEYMLKNYNDFKYYGVDINDEFIKKCKNKFPGIPFKTIEDIKDVKYKYDWFVASGVFTVYTPIKNMLETIKIAHEQAKYGVSVNFLQSTYAKNSDLEAIRGYNKMELYNIFLKEYENVKLIDGYIEDDFTIYILK